MKITKRQLKRIIKEEKSKLMREYKAIAGYYDGIPEQHMADEMAITAVAMSVQRSSNMRDQAAVNMAIGIIKALREVGFTG